MKRFSWEIVLAGLFFVAVALYLIGKPSNNNNDDPTASATPTAPNPPNTPSPVSVIDIEGLKELATLNELRDLESLQGLDQAEDLRKLKALAHLIPAEARDEFLTEIDNVLREFSNGDIQINFDSKDQLIIVKREYDNLEQGKWSETSPGIYTFLNEFDASNISSTSVSLYGGSITIVGTSEKNAKFTVQASGQISSEADLRSKIETFSSMEDNEAVFYLKSIGNPVGLNLQLQATLYIPENMELTTHTDAGHIEATNINGDQLYETGGGHIKLNRVKGDVVAVSGGGHVSIDEVTGDVTMRSSGGHLTLNNCVGDATLDTKGGNIEIKEVTGEIISSTLGGNISIFLKKLIDDITAETSAGNVQISIPTSSGADIDLQASNSVELNGFSSTAFDGSKTKSKAKGELNGGGPEVLAYTKHGQVVVNGKN